MPNVEATCQSPNSTFHEAHIFNFNVATLEQLAEKTGFACMTHFLSEDGGNLTLIARKKSVERLNQSDISIKGNSEKIIRAVRNHTPSKHYLTTHPYTRLLGRVRQVLQEKRGIASFTNGKPLLDQLYAPLGLSRSKPILVAGRGDAAPH